MPGWEFGLAPVCVVKRQAGGGAGQQRGAASQLLLLLLFLGPWASRVRALLLLGRKSGKGRQNDHCVGAASVCWALSAALRDAWAETVAHGVQLPGLLRASCAPKRPPQ